MKVATSDLTELLAASRDWMRQIQAAMHPLAELVRTELGSIGAIDTDVPQRPSPYLDLHALFRDGGPRGDDQFEAAKVRLVKLGLADLLDAEIVDQLTPAEIAGRVERAVGARCDARTYDLRENESFFLFAFAIMHYEAFSDGWQDTAWKTCKLIALGRLLEWWRYRRLGLDQMAKERKPARKAFPRNPAVADANLRRHAMAQRQHDKIRAIAAKSARTGGALERHIRHEMQRAGLEVPAPRTIRRALHERSR